MCDNLKTQGERLKYVRKMNNKTQQEIGELLHLSRDHVSRLERNKCDPTGSTIDLFCRLFGINKDWLINGNGEIYDNTVNKIECNEELKELTNKIMNLPKQQYNQVMDILKIYLEDK
jgi:transcriptional regulator with XRE-family HTH domain